MTKILKIQEFTTTVVENRHKWKNEIKSNSQNFEISFEKRYLVKDLDQFAEKVELNLNPKRFYHTSPKFTL